jgi:TetR/AcrR family transcriptional regulator, transcriptional repressor for nem operon
MQVSQLTTGEPLMLRSSADNRARLLQAAVKATYRHGFGHTSLADIAKEAKVPLGNVYYYFKTKDEIGDAIVDLRISRFRILLAELNKTDSPKERLCGFVQIKINNREALARSGCPVGTWCSELHKHRGPVAEKSKVLFTEGLAWMETQFRALGKGRESRGLAVHLMGALQGASVLAHTFHDPSLVSMEAARLKKWIRAL